MISSSTFTLTYHRLHFDDQISTCPEGPRFTINCQLLIVSNILVIIIVIDSSFIRLYSISTPFGRPKCQPYPTSLISANHKFVLISNGEYLKELD